jgi:hypothetical protein
MPFALVGVVAHQLGAVEVLDARRRRLEGGAQLGVDRVERRGDVGGRYPQRRPGAPPSKRSVRSRTASSPPSRTAARISLTAATGPSAACAGRGSLKPAQVVAARHAGPARLSTAAGYRLCLRPTMTGGRTRAA